MIVTRSRTVAAAPEAVWRVVADPRALARWWPRVERVKGVTAEGWTTVLRSDRGRPVRADWRLDAHEPPHRRAWAQELAGSPFAKVLSERRIEVRLEGSTVTLEVRQRARGWARFGGMMLRRAARRELDGALDGLAKAVS